MFSDQGRRSSGVAEGSKDMLAIQYRTLGGGVPEDTVYM